MDWVIIPKRHISLRPTACGHAPHMTHSTAPPTEAGSSPFAHAQKSHFHYQTTSAKLKYKHSNPNPCPVPVIARSVSDEAISTVHLHYQTTSAKLKNEHSNPNPCPVSVIARNARDEAIPTVQFHYQITSAKLKNEQSNPNPCPVPVIARSARDEAISTAHPEKFFSKRKADPFSNHATTLPYNTLCQISPRPNSSLAPGVPHLSLPKAPATISANQILMRSIK